MRPRLRLAIGAAFVVPPLEEWLKGKRPAGLPTSIALRIADDMIYGLGVWEGMAAHCNLAAIKPHFTSPGASTPKLASESYGAEK